MKPPFAPGTAINAKRFGRWLTSFSAYRSAITRPAIENWLKQFKKRDRDLAARILDAVEFYGQSQIHAAYRESLSALSGWSTSPKKRKGRWRFAAMSGSAGESGDGMLYQFRLANHLDAKGYNEMFVSRSQLLGENLGPDDTVVLLDDFSGTGNQVCEAWFDPDISFGELLAGVGRVYLILVVASQAARKKIGESTPISLLSAHELTDADSIFSQKCRHFSVTDQQKLLEYGKMADGRHPKGFGDCGYVVVFQHRTPSNSIPILHADNRKWSGLFPRHD